MTALRKALVFVLSVYGSLVVLLYVAQRSLIYVPSTERVHVRDTTLTDFQDVVLRTAQGERLHSWYRAADPGQPTFLFLHGNGGALGGRTAVLETLAANGRGVFAVGYPGYGGNEGSPSESALVETAELAYHHLLQANVAPGNVIVFGVSLGSAVAVQLASRRCVGALILFAPMHSVLDIAQATYPFVPVGWLLKDRFLSNEHIRAVTAPVVFVHGDNDRVIPIESGLQLFERANEPKEFRRLPGAGHNNLLRHGAMTHVNRFLRGYYPSQPATPAPSASGHCPRNADRTTNQEGAR